MFFSDKNELLQHEDRRIGERRADSDRRFIERRSDEDRRVNEENTNDAINKLKN